MTKLGIIGSGAIGAAVARLAVAAGHEVLLSNSRGPESLTALVEELGRQGSDGRGCGGIRRHRRPRRSAGGVRRATRPGP